MWGTASRPTRQDGEATSHGVTVSEGPGVTRHGVAVSEGPGITRHGMTVSESPGVTVLPLTDEGSLPYCTTEWDPILAHDLANGEIISELEVDIFGEIIWKSQLALLLYDVVTRSAPSLCKALRPALHAYVRLVQVDEEQHLYDVRDCTAAAALLSIEYVFRCGLEQGWAVTKSNAFLELQKLGQDVAILVCSRFIDQSRLRQRGITGDLQTRLIAAFGFPFGLADDMLWSRLGNSKHNLFTQGAKWEPRPGKTSPRQREQRRARTAEFAAMPTLEEEEEEEDMLDAECASEVEGVSQRPPGFSSASSASSSDAGRFDPAWILCTSTASSSSSAPPSAAPLLPKHARIEQALRKHGVWSKALQDDLLQLL